MSREILYLAHRAPFPPDRGDKIRGYHTLLHLAERARVHLVAFDDDGADPAAVADRLASVTLVPRTKSKARATLEALASGRSVSVAAFADPALSNAVRRVLDAHQIDGIHVFSSAMAQYVPEDWDKPFVMDFCDVDAAKFDEYARQSRFPLSLLYAREARTLAAFDRAVAARASASLFVSDAEADLFRRSGGRGHLAVVGNGIDTRRFDPGADFAPVREAGPLIVFTGQMDYPPNVAAVKDFACDILPAIRARHPGVRFAIVGRAPTAEVQALAGEGVIVTGAVPDTRGWIAAATAIVAPLRIARGVQNKVLEAMAMARPVVVSPAAGEGIDHGGSIRIAGDTAFPHAVCDLIADPAAADALGRSARARVEALYGWDAQLAPLAALHALAPEPLRSAA